MLGCGLCGGTVEVAAAAVIGAGGLGVMTSYAFASLLHRFSRAKKTKSIDNDKGE